MKPTNDHPWPPLITNVKIPWYVRARDWAFTLFAWAAMGTLLRRGIWMIQDYFTYPFFRLNHYTAPNWVKLWNHFYIAVYASIFMVLWIVIWTLRRVKQIRRVHDPRHAHPLTMEEHARSLGLDPEKVKKWRQFKVATVQFTGADLHQIADVQSGNTLGKEP
jgi:poly-beta-1,6-N-acetyl-D-glucosamine biosynthesis protein PgaD